MAASEREGEHEATPSLPHITSQTLVIDSFKLANIWLVAGEYVTIPYRKRVYCVMRSSRRHPKIGYTQAAIGVSTAIVTIGKTTQMTNQKQLQYWVAVIEW